MSSTNTGTPTPKSITAPGLLKQKQQGRKIVSLTCYDYTTARLLDDAGVDILLVGDSLAMTVLGYPDTVSVTMEEMLHHARAVSRGTSRSLVVADMPFMSYQLSTHQAVENAGRFMQEARVSAVKLEGASPMVLDGIRHMTAIGIPVMGHLGFTPQSVHTIGGFKVQGKSLKDAKTLLEDAQKLQDAGVFALVLEMVPVEVAAMVTSQLDIPTIGIGSGNNCDGQILVVDDVLGRYPDLSPRFVRRYLESDVLIKEAIQAFRQDIETGAFPNNETEAFGFPSDLLPSLGDTGRSENTDQTPQPVS
ncbi:MAG: 3-methyl-2-oxobutanoate hydroxymethyltransferase [Vampirovibrio sp.]|nr:3-methyl-2-oxobutanoate hydroxymethyltransferase [Vampirovibrio sp.]